MKIFFYIVASLLFQIGVYVSVKLLSKKVWAIFLTSFLFALAFVIGVLPGIVLKVNSKELLILAIVNLTIGLVITAVIAIKDIKMKKRKSSEN